MLDLLYQYCYKEANGEDKYYSENEHRYNLTTDCKLIIDWFIVLDVVT